VKRFLIKIGLLFLLGGALLACAFSYVIYTGPRMKEQPHLRTYQAIVPALPQGSVPAQVPTTLEDSAAQLAGPVAATQADLANGKTYYTYYCVFCHGEKGDRIGAVGESFTPAPADLRTDRIRRMSRPQLLKSMLTGVGHGPVLEMVVHPKFRRDLVLYVATLAQGENRRSSQ
jgi:cytochrome c1